VIINLVFSSKSKEKSNRKIPEDIDKCIQSSKPGEK
jgi:hypothetical protein